MFVLFCQYFKHFYGIEKFLTVKFAPRLRFYVDFSLALTSGLADRIEKDHWRLVLLPIILSTRKL